MSDYYLIKQELIKMKGKKVTLNGFLEYSGYVLSLHLPSLKRISENVYESNPI